MKWSDAGRLQTLPWW